MKRPAVTAMVGVPAAAVIWWSASNTSWGETKVPLPPRGDARPNPVYAAQRFAEGLGARTSWDRQLTLPPVDAVIVVSSWHWSLSAARQRALERWVESGGRLIVDDALLGGDNEFADWSGIRLIARTNWS